MSTLSWTLTLSSLPHPSSSFSSPANNTVTHTRSPKMSSHADEQKTYEAFTSSRHRLTWTETTWGSTPCSRAVNPDSWRQCCLVPTGMTGIRALNVTVFLCWLQQRETGRWKGHITSTSPTYSRLSGPPPVSAEPRGKIISHNKRHPENTYKLNWQH